MSTKNVDKSIRKLNAAKAVSKGYVNFTSAGIKVDIGRYLKSESGKSALRKIDLASQGFVKKAG